MTTTIKLALANREVNHLFTRKLAGDVFFYKAVMNKVASLMKRSESKHVYALLALLEIKNSIDGHTYEFYDELDRLEGVLDKKKHLAGKTFNFAPSFYPEVDFNSSIAALLVEFFEVYDRLLSTLKILRVSQAFGSDDDYFTYLRRYFKSVNQLLSRIHLTKVHSLPTVTFMDAIDNSDTYQIASNSFGEVNYSTLYEVITSNLAPRLEEKIRGPLLQRLKKKIDEKPTETALEILQCA